MKLSDRLAAENDFVEKELRDLTICDRCKATLFTYAADCNADMSDACPGFLAIEKVRRTFHELKPKKER